MYLINTVSVTLISVRNRVTDTLITYPNYLIGKIKVTDTLIDSLI